MKIEDLVREVILNLERRNLSTTTNNVCDYLHDNYDWESLGFTLNDIYDRSRWSISKMRK